MRQFALISGAPRVSAASAYPISFNEAPTYQRLYVNDDRSEKTSDAVIENAVSEATEQLHDDTAYEFEMRWKLWAPETVDAQPGNTDIDIYPGFDDAPCEQNGHIRVDFGLDTPWLAETIDDEHLDEDTAKHIQQNVEMLLAFTLSVEKNSGISSRLLWTESGEPLAQKLIDRLQRVN